jgi:hypothetical protein
LNILAATALLSVRFSFRNFFALFIAMKWRWWYSWFWFEKKLENELENQITAIIRTTNEVSGDLYHRIFMRWVI